MSLHAFSPLLCLNMCGLLGLLGSHGLHAVCQSVLLNLRHLLGLRRLALLRMRGLALLLLGSWLLTLGLRRLRLLVGLRAWCL